MENNELFGEFVSASVTEPAVEKEQEINTLDKPSLNELKKNTDNYIVDNTTIYKKLLQLESEIHNLKLSVNDVRYKQQINNLFLSQQKIPQPFKNYNNYDDHNMFTRYNSNEIRRNSNNPSFY
jgi:hypothetical protein